MYRVGTDEEFDFSAPPGATVCSDWRAFGAANDWMYVAFTNWAFQVGTNEIDRLRLFSFGKVDPLIREADGRVATNNWFAPFMATLGIVPEANWDLLAESDRPSQLWHCITLQNSLVVTWQNALLDRDTDTPLSFQAEFFPNGRFIYRYDLSRLNVETVSNILAGASFGGNEWTTNALPTNVTSMAFYPLSEEDIANQDRDGDGLSLLDELFAFGTDPDFWDTDCDGVSDGDEVAAGTNPRSRDSDGDGLVDGSDPDPAVQTSLADLDGDGIPTHTKTTGSAVPTHSIRRQTATTQDSRSTPRSSAASTRQTSWRRRTWSRRTASSPGSFSTPLPPTGRRTRRTLSGRGRSR